MSPDPLAHFDQQKAASYDDRWVRLAPLRDSLHLQTSLILEELPAQARVLCVGVGTGAELLALAARFPGWRFVAVDPSAPMLEHCRRRTAEAGIASRCEFHVAYVHELPATVRDVDAATAILVSHFITERAQRLAFFREIARRSRPGGLLVTADLGASPPAQHARLLAVWRQMMRYTGAGEESVQHTCASLGREVALLSESEMQALLVEAGFQDPVHFSQSLLIHAWYARRP